MKKKLNRTEATLKDKLPVLDWMRENKTAVFPRSDELNAKAINKEFGYSWTPIMVKNLRKALGWDRAGVQKTPKYLRIHLDDWEARLSALEARLERLETSKAG